MSRYTAIDLFSGAGGLSLGIRNAGFTSLVANEIEPDFARTFALNHPECLVLNQDIHQVDFHQVLKTLSLKAGQVDLVCGGPPCQGFSTVGSKNSKDPRNSLFYEFIRAVFEVKPSYVLFENVSGFRNLYGGAAYHALTQELTQLGYETRGAVLNAADFGLPQNRLRMIVVGWLKSLPPVALPQPSHFDAPDLLGGHKKTALMDAISDLPELRFGELVDEYRSAPCNALQARLRGSVKVLTEHNMANHGEKMREILSLIPVGGSVMDLPERLRPKAYFKNTYARLLPDKPSPTITRNFGTPSSSRCVHPFQNRALSTREGARLQGFPDSYQFHGSKVSKNLQIGNAVPPIFGEVIARQIVASIKASEDRQSMSSEALEHRVCI